MKSWIYYLIPLLLLVVLVMLPSLLEKNSMGSPPVASSNITPAPRAVGNVAPASTPLPQPAQNPGAQLLDINFLDLRSKEYRPVADGSVLPADTHHFNAKIRNTGAEAVLVYYDLVQSDGVRLVPLGAGEWLVSPGQEVYLFMQGANLKPAGKNVQLNFVLKERGSEKVLDKKTLNVSSR